MVYTEHSESAWAIQLDLVSNPTQHHTSEGISGHRPTPAYQKGDGIHAAEGRQ